MKQEKKPITHFKVTLFAFLGAIIWTMHFMMIYALSEFGCVAHANWTKAAIIGLTFLFFGAGGYSIFKCRKLSKSIDKTSFPDAYFLARYGILNNSVFTFIVVFQSLPIFYFRGECL